MKKFVKSTIGITVSRDENIKERQRLKNLGIDASDIPEETREFKEMDYYFIPENILEVTETVGVKDEGELTEGTVIFFNDERGHSPTLFEPISSIKEKLKGFCYEF